MDINKYKYIKYKYKYLKYKQKHLTRKTIIMTVPHSKCENETENICDQTSLPIAERLKSKFENKNFNVIFLPTNIHRVDCDVNRKNCGHTSESNNKEYYNNFRSVVLDNPKAIHLDIHSYPNYDSFSLIDINNYSTHQNRIMVLLSNKNNIRRSRHFRNHLNENQIGTTLLEGGENYLTNYSGAISGYNNPNNKLPFSILLEFYDKHNFTDNELDKIVSYFLSLKYDYN